MNCQQCRIEIEETDARRDDVSRAAEAHLECCAPCRAFSVERQAVRRLVGELDPVVAPPEFEFLLRARLAAAKSLPAPRFGWLRLSPAALSMPLLAGCLALFVIATLYFNQQPSLLNAQQQQQQPAPAANAITETQVAQSSPAVDPAIINDLAMNIEPVTIGEGVTPKKSTVARRRRQELSRAVRVAIEMTAANNGREDSNPASIGNSPVRFTATNAGVAENGGALIPVQLNAPERPMQILLKDNNGTSRMVSVAPVSFGARDMIGRPAPAYTNASLSNQQGTW